MELASCDCKEILFNNCHLCSRWPFRIYCSLFYNPLHGPAAYGVLAFAYSFVALFSIFGNLGFNQAHIKRVSEGKDLGTCIGTFFTTKTGLTGLMIFLTLVVIIIWKTFLGRGFESPIHETAVYIMLGYWIIRTIALVMVTTFQGKKEIAKAQLPMFSEVLIRTIAIIIVAYLGWGIIPLVMTYIVGDITFFFTSLYFFRNYPIKNPSLEYFKDYVHFAIPLSIVIASSLIMTNIDKVLIQLFWSATEGGYYFAAYRILVFINLFTISIGLLLFPTYSSLHAKKDVKGIQNLTLTSERYLSMIVFPLVFGTIALARPIAKIMLSSWAPTIPILEILTLFALLDALERPYQTQFMGMGYPKLARNRILIMVIINITLNIILIPRNIPSLGINLLGLGAQGAAIATVISYGIGLGYSRIMAWKLIGIKGNLCILLHLFSAVIMVSGLYGLSTLIEISRWYILIIFGLTGLSIYIGVLFLLREFKKEDFELFRDSFNIKKMINYIITEIRGES